MEWRNYMCGIAGYIGQSKKPKLTYELITALFDYLEIRGTDAAGVWGTETGKNGRVIYHKEPIKSSQFIKNSFWKKLRKVKMDMMLVHARATSRGGGHASTNSNNHPFVSDDKKLAMIHNGTLDEATFLKKKYQIRSQTDSEVLLRMYEHGLDESPLEISNGPVCFDIAKRMNGIKEIWSLISKGAMAVSFGERIDDHTRYMFLFRNQKRPLWIADLRDVLGQVFFFSSPEIWYRAIASSDVLKKVCSSSEKLIEIPTEQVWCFKVTEEIPSITRNSEYYKFEMDVSKQGDQWKAGELRLVKGPEEELSVISQLDDEEKITRKNDHKKNKQLPVYNQQQHPNYDWEPDEPNPNDPDDYADAFCQNLFNAGGTEHETTCKQIVDLVNSVEIAANNSVMEGSMSPHEYLELVESLNQTRVDLEGTLALVGGH
jgi:predicted glutamine amidotransferase